MFIGHYGPGFAINVWKRTIPLWVLFLAVQLVDIFWSIFVILGIEKVRIVPGITATNPLDLYYMPYTHSLLGAAVWSVIAAIAYRWFARLDGWLAAAIVGAAVFSHSILDLIVHRPDLPLYDDSYKVGLGLWNYPGPALRLEIALLFGGIFLYLRATTPKDTIGRYGMVVFGLDHGGGAGLCLLRPAAGFGQGRRGDGAGALFRIRGDRVLAGAKAQLVLRAFLLQLQHALAAPLPQRLGLRRLHVEIEEFVAERGVVDHG